MTTQMTIPGEAVQAEERVKARAAAVICEVGALCGWPKPDCKSREAAQALLDAGLLSAIEVAPSPRAQALEEAARNLIANRFDSYKARNGKLCSIEGDDGEKCWIVSFDDMAELESALSSQPVADGWLPIETAPKDGTHILSLSDDGVHEVARVDLGCYGIWKVHGVSDSYYGDMHCNPTHWRPLPASPGASATRPTGGSNHGG